VERLTRKSSFTPEKAISVNKGYGKPTLIEIKNPVLLKKIQEHSAKPVFSRMNDTIDE